MAADDHRHAERPIGAGQERNRQALWVALGITSAFLAVEAVGAYLTGSLALLADAGHMLGDVGALGLALFASAIAARPATPARTYGYYRVEVLAALANAVLLVLIALYVFWEASQRLGEPPAVRSLPMLGVALAGLGANLASARVLSAGAAENINLRGAFLHVLGDVAGSLGAVLAGLVMLLTGWYYADPLVSLLIGLLILYSGWGLLRESVDILLEATPPGVDLSAIERGLLALPQVAGVHDLHAWAVTSGFLALSGHLTLRDRHYEQALLAATHLLRDRFGITHATLQLESPADEATIHHGCYFGARSSVCVAGAQHRHPDRPVE